MPRLNADFEQRLQRAEHGGADVLQVWTDYVQWARSQSPDQARPLMQRACDSLARDPRTKQDIRYLRLWVWLAEKDAQPARVFEQLESRGVGTGHALLFEAWANALEMQRSFEKTAEVYRRGVACGAQPEERLKSRRAEFEERMRRRAARDISKTVPKPQSRRHGHQEPVAQPQLPERRWRPEVQQPTPSLPQLREKLPNFKPPQRPQQVAHAKPTLQKEFVLHKLPKQLRLQQPEDAGESDLHGGTVSEVVPVPQRTGGSRPRLTCRKQVAACATPAPTESTMGTSRKRPQEVAELSNDHQSGETFQECAETTEHASAESGSVAQPVKRRRLLGRLLAPWRGIFGKPAEQDFQQDEGTLANLTDMTDINAAERSAAALEAQAAEAQRTWAAGLESMGQALLEERDLEVPEEEVPSEPLPPTTAARRRFPISWLPF